MKELVGEEDQQCGDCFKQDTVSDVPIWKQMEILYIQAKNSK